MNETTKTSTKTSTKTETIEPGIPATWGRRRASVYALTDPRTNACRYVGVTTDSLPERRRKHLAPTKLLAKTPLGAWLRELGEQGLHPYITLLEQVEPLRPGEVMSQDGKRFFLDVQDAERRWISDLDKTHDLLNRAPGGGGPLLGGYTWGAESRQRLSRAKSGTNRAGSSSRFPGVCFHQATGKWMAQFQSRYLGVFEEEHEAFDTYCLAYKNHFGKDAALPVARA